MTARFRTAFAGLMIGAAMFSPHADAQSVSASLTHTVSVTVAPRVKVQAQAFSSMQQPSMNVSSTTVADSGVRLSINATQRWVLSVRAAASSKNASHVRWSATSDGAFAPVTSTTAIVASGALSSQPAQADLFLRNDGKPDDTGAVLLTIVTP